MPSDQDSIAEAAELAVRAHLAFEQWKDASQETVDRVTEAMAHAGSAAAEPLARLAYEETGYGRPSHKVFKNTFNTIQIWERIRDERTVGVIARDSERKVIEIAEPVGVIAGLVPVTNPTSTVLFKSLIALKSRNAVVFAPHPRAVRCTDAAAKVMEDAAVAAGAPPGLVQAMTRVSLAGTDALMRHHRVDLVLATGSRAMVLAAYSSGKPTYAVGPGNTPAYVHASVADPDFAAGCVMAAKIFDWGTACASEQSAIVDRAVAPRLRAAMERRGALFLDDRQQSLLTRMVLPQGGGGPASTDIVGQSPATLAALAGFSVPETTSLLVVEPGGIGPDFPLSRELLCPIFKWLEVDGPDEGIPTACAQSRYGGDGHTAAVHAADEAIIARFAAAIPAYRVCVNTAGLYGAMGHSTGFHPSFMLGTGTIGGSISSDNIGPLHLINRKRVGAQIRAWEEPVVTPEEGRVAPWARERAAAAQAAAPAPAAAAAAPAPEAAPPPGGESIEELVRRAVESVMGRG